MICTAVAEDRRDRAHSPPGHADTDAAQAHAQFPDLDDQSDGETLIKSGPVSSTNVGSSDEIPADSGDIDGPDTLPGTMLAGRYLIDRMIARGGMGRVYLATQLPLERKVAIKVVSTRQANDPQFVRRFFLEASVCAKLSHPNIVTVHDYGKDDHGRLFMAMEHLDGMPLAEAIERQGRMAPRRVLSIAIQISRALREAHAHGVIHRDLKPGNIMLLHAHEEDGGDVVKVLDFGLVKIFDAKGGQPMLAADEGRGKNLTRAGSLIGSPRYMAPEQIRNEPLDPRTDIYALGIIIYELASGQTPFLETTSIIETLHQHLHAQARPLVDFPPEATRVVHRCLEKERDARYPSVADLLVDLKRALRAIEARDDRGDDPSSSNAGLWQRSEDSFGSLPPLDGVSRPSLSANFGLETGRMLRMETPRPEGQGNGATTAEVRARSASLTASLPGVTPAGGVAGPAVSASALGHPPLGAGSPEPGSSAYPPGVTAPAVTATSGAFLASSASVPPGALPSLGGAPASAAFGAATAPASAAVPPAVLAPAKRGPGWLVLAAIGAAAVLALAAVFYLAPAPTPPQPVAPPAPGIRTPPPPTRGPRLMVESRPTGATVREAGQVLGQTPLSIPLDAAEKGPRQFEVTLPGYAPYSFRQTPTTQDNQVVAELVASPVESPDSDIPGSTKHRGPRPHSTRTAPRHDPGAPAPSTSPNPDPAPGKAPGDDDIRLTR